MRTTRECRPDADAAFAGAASDRGGPLANGTGLPGRFRRGDVCRCVGGRVVATALLSVVVSGIAACGHAAAQTVPGTAAPAGAAASGSGVSIEFAAVPPRINPGSTTVLSWRVRNAVQCDILRGTDPTGIIVDLPEGRSPPLRLEAEGRQDYRMTCRGMGGGVSNDTSVTVQKAARIMSFTADQATVPLRGATRLWWTTERADRCTLNPGEESVAPDPRVPVDKAPALTTTYSLECSGVGPPAARSVLVTVPPVRIESFTFTPDRISYPGGTVKLTWNAENVADGCVIDNRIGSVPPRGERDVQPADTTTYHLTCPGSGGPAVAEATVPVAVPWIRSFEANPKVTSCHGRTTLTWVIQFYTGPCQMEGGAGVRTIDRPFGSGSYLVDSGRITTFRLKCPQNQTAAVDVECR